MVCSLARPTFVSHARCHAPDRLHTELVVLPTEGTLAPYSSAPLEFIFSPKAPLHIEGRAEFMTKERLDAKSAFSIPYHSVARIECTESKQRLLVPVLGNGMEPLVTRNSLRCHVLNRACSIAQFSFSPDNFDFGDCAVHARRDILCTLTNKSDHLPLNFSFARVAHFAVKPSAGKVLPHQSLSLVVSFVPRQVRMLALFFQCICM